MAQPFLGPDFMLHSPTAKHLFHDYAEKLPLVDYHCHISPKEIFEDRRFNNLAEVWLGGRQADGSYAGDHYKWRLMRSHGIPEEVVTGSVDPFERFRAFAGALEKAIGNPMYHWCHLELQKFFGVQKPLTVASAREIWEQCNDRLQHDPKCTVRGLIRQSNVAYIGTTDDPADSLEWHEKIAADRSVDFLVCPSFRPDKAVNLHKAGYADYLKKLAAAAGRGAISSLDDLLQVLEERVLFFVQHGCRASDHGLDTVVYREGTKEAANAAMQKALAGAPLTQEEIEIYQTKVLLHLARLYHKHDIVMEIHYSCYRNANGRMFRLEGPDTGYDMIGQNRCGAAMAQFLDALEATNALPKTIFFSLDESDFNLIGTLLGCFQGEEVPGKMQMGAAWWFLDSRDGMEKQMRSLANLSLLGNFVGMLTDSRSFLSYTRHDYFRRICCNLIGKWVEDGEYPSDEAALQAIVEGISYRNACRYFGI